MKHVLAGAICLLIATTGPAARAAGDAAAGRIKSEGCMGCHGIPGYTNAYPTYHVPKLTGQHAEYLVAALKAYKEKQRPHATMQAQAANLSEEDMQDIAAFWAGAGK